MKDIIMCDLLFYTFSFDDKFYLNLFNISLNRGQCITNTNKIYQMKYIGAIMVVIIAAVLK